MTHTDNHSPDHTTDRARTSKVAFLGIGNMAEAIMAGSLRGGLDPRAVQATARHRDRLDRIAGQYGVGTTTSNPEAVAGADLIVVGVEPEQVGGVLDEIADTVPATSVVVSLAGGVSTADLETHLPEGTAVVRVMPNTPALAGAGMAGLTPGAHCTEDQLQKVAEFFALSGEVIVVPEEQQAAVGALSGSGPAHVFYVVDAMIEAGVTLGLRREVAHRLAVQTIVGAGALLQDTGEHPVLLRERVSSPGGTTIAALGELDDRAVRAAFVSAITGRFRP
jgi:pyrroline-5-carboxylate reductase